MKCPIDGGAAFWLESVGYYVCQTCQEMLSASELVPRSTRRTRRAYVKITHPTASRAWLQANGYAA